MKLLLLHQNFPGQFRHMAQAWAKLPGWQVLGLGREGAPGLPPESGVAWGRYALHRPPRADQHHYLKPMEAAVLHGQAVARELMALKAKGYKPDAVLAHPGWGESLYVKDVFPEARLLHLCEWFYGQPGSDAGFDPAFPTSFDAMAKLRSWNALHLLNLNNCDAAITPTRWQWQQHPAAYRDKIEVIHEGVDTLGLGPDGDATLTLPTGQVLRAGEPVITFVARNLEPYRGFHSFMRALALVQQAHPSCQTVVIGGDGVSYGSPAPGGVSWREHLLAEVQIDPARTHFLGRVPYATYRRALQVSAAHVCLSYPFVMSWSLLEAMASGCAIVGSATAPVQEVISPGRNGVLVDFLKPADIADGILSTLTGPTAALRQQARTDVAAGYSLAQGLAGYQAVLCPR